MSGLFNSLHELHQQHKERREEHRDARHGRGHHNDYDDHDDHGSQYHSQRPYQADDDDLRRPSYQSKGQDEGRGYTPPHGPPPSSYSQRPSQLDDNDFHRPQSYESRGQDQGSGYGSYAPPAGPPPSARGNSGFAVQGGLDRSDFATDADIDRMVAAGEFDDRQTSGRQEYGSGYGRGSLEHRNAYGQQDASARPHPGQGHGEHANDYGRYDAPSGPPPGRDHQNQQSFEQSYGPGSGEGPDRSNQHGFPRTQGRTQYDSPQVPLSGYGRGQGNAPAGGFSASRDGEDRYGSGYDGPTNDRSEPPRRSEAASYYNQQNVPGQDDRYAHLVGLAQERGDDDPELYRRATQGLHEKIQAQQSRPRKKYDDDDDYKAQVDAHRKAYGGDDQGPMSADAIGAAAAMEAIKQTAASAPAGGFQASKVGGPPSKAGKVAQEEDEEVAGMAAERAGASGGLQDKLMALAMSQAGKLFDKKNAGSSGVDKPQDKAQAMQSAAATAMQLFTKYQAGKLDSSDMTSVMTLAMKML